MTVRVSERCVCGSSIEVEADSSLEAGTAMIEWRSKHQAHVGTCPRCGGQLRLGCAKCGLFAPTP